MNTVLYRETKVMDKKYKLVKQMGFEFILENVQSFGLSDVNG